MNKVLVVLVTDQGVGKIDAGGVELHTEQGVRELLGMAKFAQDTLTEALVTIRAKELVDNAKAEDLPTAGSDPE